MTFYKGLTFTEAVNLTHVQHETLKAYRESYLEQQRKAAKRRK